MTSRLLILGFCILPLSSIAEPSLSPEQERLFVEFRSCLYALPKQGDSTVVSPCAHKEAASLSGVSRAMFLAKLGRPDWCAFPKRQLLPWSEQTCAPAPVWGYSFYRLVGIGGGPELQVTFGNLQVSTAVAWVHTQ